MTPGFYVVRVPPRRSPGSRVSLIIESRPFADRDAADRWASFVKSEYPKHDVSVMEILQPGALSA